MGVLIRSHILSICKGPKCIAIVGQQIAIVFEARSIASRAAVFRPSIVPSAQTFGPRMLA